jgi:putative flippase GtrA
MKPVRAFSARLLPSASCPASVVSVVQDLVSHAGLLCDDFHGPGERMRDLVRQASRFGLVGLINTAVGLSLIWLAMASGLPAIPANAIGYLVGIMVSFMLNRAWTFRLDGRKQVRASVAFRRFFIAAGAAWILNIAVVWSGLELTGISPYLLQLFGVATYSASFFVMCRTWVFTDLAPKIRE